MRNHSLAWYVVHQNLHDDNDDDTTLESVLSLSFDKQRLDVPRVVAGGTVPSY